MLEMSRTQIQNVNPCHMSQPSYEVLQFMRNFYEAVHEGNPEEISSYYADEMEPFNFPLNAEWTDETLLVEDHLATFSCTLQACANTEIRLTCVLDKSEGYWQIIHGEIHQDAPNRINHS